MQIERSATSVSWIPSDSIPAPLKLPFEQGVLHYDPPPPLTISDLEGMRRRGHFRFANVMRAWIDVEDGQIRDYAYSGAGLMGLTPVTVGSLHLLLPARANPEIRLEPVATGDAVTFAQTAGARPVFSLLKPSAHWPFVVTHPFTIWTTIELTIGADGSSTQRLAGASPFPRHWLYDDAGHLVEKTALTQAMLWESTVFGSHTPWGGHDQAPEVAPPETELERVLSERVMQGGPHPHVRVLHAGEFLFHEAEPGTAMAVILDGTFEVRVNDQVLGQVGPGTVVGERASLEDARRTAGLRALTEARVAEAAPGLFSTEQLSELAQGHYRENSPAGP